MKDGIVIDLDGTLTIDDPNKEYDCKNIQKDVKEAVNRAAVNFRIEVFTARNMRSLNGDPVLLESITKPIAKKWLKENQVHHDDLVLGKPWCGKNGFYVDDKNLHVEEFVFHFSNFFATKTVDVCVSFYNEQSNAENFHYLTKRVERLFHVSNFYYVNNGSNDNTLEVLNDLAKRDEKIVVLSNLDKSGYGAGFKKAIIEAKADYVLTCHSDLQFDPYLFFLSNLDDIPSHRNPEELFVVLSKRLNRMPLERLISLILRVFLSICMGKRIGEFNGQPKLFPRPKKSKISKAPDDFSFDFWLVEYLRKFECITLPVISKARALGVTSWNFGLFSKFRVFYSYFKTSVRLRKEFEK